MTSRFAFASLRRRWQKPPIHPAAQAQPRVAARLTRFATSNRTAGTLATLVALATALFAPPRDPALWVALAWLCSPLLLAFLPRLTPHPGLCHLAALVNLAAAVTFLVALTGGPRSFLIAWFVVIPIEAAVSHDRRLIAVGVTLAAIGVAVVTAWEQFGLLPGLFVPFGDDTMLHVLGAVGAVGYAAGLALTIEDLSTEAEASIRAGEARYRLLAEHAGDLITRHGPDGRIGFASPAATRLSGFEPWRLLGLEATALAHPDDRTDVMLAFMRASHLDEESRAAWRLVRIDGRALWVETTFRPAPSPAGAEIIAVTRDITVRKEAEEALVAARNAAEEASRAKSRFLANMSHELRTPLNAIIGFSDMMRQEMFGPLGADRYRGYAGDIHQSGTLLLDLINDVLDMAKIEAGKREVKRERINPADVVARALTVVRPLAESRGLVLEHVGSIMAAPALEADRRALQQILLNLLSNAIKFTPEGGRVSVAVTGEGDSVRFDVRDTGIGIAPGDLPRLGKPFEQVEGDYARAHEGTGLGLALVRSLAELHGGTMSIASAPGEGTCVSIRLPVGVSKAVSVALRGAA